MDTELLLRTPLFSELPPAEVGRLASTLPTIQLAPGEALFRQGDAGNAFYIVITGRVEAVLAMGTAEEKVIASFGAGDFVGEMSLLESAGHRAAGVRALEAARLWMVTRQEFDELLHRFPRIAYSMVQVISKRLTWTNDAAFRDLQRKNAELQQAYDELKAAHAAIVEKERLERELQLARQIQMSILPNTLPTAAGYDFGGLVEPAREVGGDFYDVITLDDHTDSIFIGDVADKGAPSAIFMARTHALLTAEATKGMPPEEVLHRVNAHLTRMDRSDLFVTVLYGLLDRRTGTFAYARAGHEIPLLLHADGKVERMPYGRGQVIGMFEGISLDRQDVQIPSGATLLIYTDGMTDGRNPEGSLFGLPRLCDALSRLAGRSAQEVCSALLQVMSGYRGSASQDDDITLLAIHAQ
jgi:serine phosphatase RsbU (regulator of sigma subunit)